jgi:GTPase
MSQNKKNENIEKSEHSKISADKESVDKESANKVSANKVSVDKESANKVSVDKESADKESANKKCGYVGIIGQPNVGKSTLLNDLVGQKLSITCKKPATTRHQIIGVLTEDDAQMVFVDTPGISFDDKTAMTRYLNKAALEVITGMQVLLVVLTRLGDKELKIIEALKAAKIASGENGENGEGNVPVIAVINKIDLVKDKTKLLPLIQQISEAYLFSSVIPVSAKTKDGIDELKREITKYLPKSDFYYPEDTLTTRSEKFLVQEIIREKLFRLLGDELPYGLTVDVIHFKEVKKRVDISANIYVSKPSHKQMVIGKGGLRLKDVGSKARLDIEKLIGQKVYLQLWVRVKENWSDDQRSLSDLGYS